jgi:hypothetical protein
MHGLSLPHQTTIVRSITQNHLISLLCRLWSLLCACDAIKAHGWLFINVSFIFRTLILIVLLVHQHLANATSKELPLVVDGASKTSPFSEQVLFDKVRHRAIPVAFYTAKHFQASCLRASPCPVAILSSGYGLRHTDYGFLADTLVKLGYLVIAVHHELPSDPPLSVTGKLFETRSENWQRGADTLRFVRSQLKQSMTGFDFDHLLLIGHSNGGDISAWLANEMLAENEAFIDTVITLDSRRVPLPKHATVKLLSIRGSDFPADKGILPTVDEQHVFGLYVTTIPNSRHNDMYDGGPVWLKAEIRRQLFNFLQSDKG